MSDTKPTKSKSKRKTAEPPFTMLTGSAPWPTYTIDDIRKATEEAATIAQRTQRAAALLSDGIAAQLELLFKAVDRERYPGALVIAGRELAADPTPGAAIGLTPRAYWVAEEERPGVPVSRVVHVSARGQVDVRDGL